MNKIKILAFLFTLAAVITILTSCGEDTTNNNNTGGTPPTLNMQVGSVYTLNVDSIPISGPQHHTILKNTMTFLAQGTYFGQSGFQVRSVTRDSLNVGPSVIDTFYVRYDGGKFYQYGTLQLIDPSLPGSWDMVADFNVATGTQWDIATGVAISYIPGVTANIRGKVAEETSFTTYGFGNRTVHCYRSELTAELMLGPTPVGTIYLDYYIGDANPSTNPSGLVRITLRPINISIYQSAGVDQAMQTWTP
jgi:hypothetical protein